MDDTLEIIMYTEKKKWQLKSLLLLVFAMKKCFAFIQEIEETVLILSRYRHTSWSLGEQGNFVRTLDCGQSLFCSKIQREKRKEKGGTAQNECASMICGAANRKYLTSEYHVQNWVKVSKCKRCDLSKKNPNRCMKPVQSLFSLVFRRPLYLWLTASHITLTRSYWFVVFLAFFPTDFQAKERLLAVYRNMSLQASVSTGFSVSMSVSITQ